MSIHLYKHNEDAYRAVETMLEDKQMAAVIHPTGTGKSMIAFKLVEQHPHKHFLWLSPSEYIYKTQLENIDTQFSNIEYMSYSRLMKHEDSIDCLLYTSSYPFSKGCAVTCMGESMGIPQEGRNNPLPMLCSYVVPFKLRHPGWCIRTC